MANVKELKILTCNNNHSTINFKMTTDNIIYDETYSSASSSASSSSSTYSSSSNTVTTIDTQNKGNDVNEEMDVNLKFSSFVNLSLNEKQIRDLFYKQYSLGKRIGKGGFGTIFSAVRKSDSKPVAVKVIPKTKVTQWYSILQTEKREENSNQCENDIIVTNKIPLEIALMIRVKNVKKCIQILDYLEQKNCFIIVMEREEKSQDLFDYITENGGKSFKTSGNQMKTTTCQMNKNYEYKKIIDENNDTFEKNTNGLDEPSARDYFKQIVEAVLTIRKLGVIHRDLKDENILINLQNREIKLIDFGAGAFLNDERQQIFHDFHGTRVYSPPEWILTQSYHGDSATVWSLGVLLFNMLHGDIPWEDDNDIVNCRLYSKKNSLSINRLETDSGDLIEKCLKINDFERIKLDEILSHHWFQSNSSN